MAFQRRFSDARNSSSDRKRYQPERSGFVEPPPFFNQLNESSHRGPQDHRGGDNRWSSVGDMGFNGSQGMEPGFRREPPIELPSRDAMPAHPRSDPDLKAKLNNKLKELQGLLSIHVS